MTTPRPRDAGDSALLLSLAPVIDVEVNAHALAIAAAVRRRAVPGVRDVVPTYRSVAVYFDPLRTDLPALHAALAEVPDTLTPERGRTLEIPVSYGGAHGPDLDAVAAHAGLSPEQVVDLHTGRAFRVCMMGFLPGFAYLGPIDPRLAMPRRATPRPRVAAGSVAVAARQTGIYPIACPGGWHIIGRTSCAVFDPRRVTPSLLSPGDHVRFVRDDTPQRARDTPERAVHLPHVVDGAARFMTIVSPGLLTTVQDSGRWGYQAIGVSVSGAMDAIASRAANALVGNDDRAATLEVTIGGPEIRLETGATLAVTGADLGVTLNASSMPMDIAVSASPGSVLRFVGRRAGARAYVAFAGGIDVAPMLGSRATQPLVALGGVAGRALRAGDRLALGVAQPAGTRRSWRPQPLSAGGARVRVLPGPHDDCFSDEAREILTATRFMVGSRSDRMAYHLSGDRRVPRLPGEMISDATFTGGIQIPASGEPLLLLADRQTTGGYPLIATVITADLPKVAQCAPGDWIELTWCTRAEALAALIAQEAQLLGTH